LGDEISKEEIQKMIIEAMKTLKEEEKRDKELEEKRGEYEKKIRQYFPLAKDEILKKKSSSELKEMAEKIEKIAKDLGHTPAPVRKEPQKLPLLKALKENFVMIGILIAGVSIGAIAFLLR